jgi:hypothetical protein
MQGGSVKIIGGHTIIYSKGPEVDRAFLRHVLKLTHVDVGEGWLIFGLPPAEVAIHPSDENDLHEFFFMCDDIQAFVATMRRNNIACDRVEDRGYGLVTEITLPGGGKLGVYQPRHPRPRRMGAAGSRKRPRKSIGKKGTRTGRAKVRKRSTKRR